MSGRAGAIQLELLVEAILDSWKPPEIDLDKITLDKLNESQGYSEAGFRYYF